MSSHEVYFKNHNKVLLFPWSIYHRPLLENLESFLRTNISADTRILVIGPGDFDEIFLLTSLGAEISIMDIDPRVLEMHKSRHHQIKDFFLVDEDFGGYPSEELFDLIYAKEVIEHIVDYPSFLKRLHKMLRPKGKIWLSTPNYGFFLLPLLESTVLEFIAMASGFSRRDIHPSKFSETKLYSSVHEQGFKNIKTLITFLKLALIITAERE
jgi:2-polyprenyl-3-methyl-5-hydroxy-6-metoxy-1,4-benzoquinol methylase